MKYISNKSKEIQVKQTFTGLSRTRLTSIYPFRRNPKPYMKRDLTLAAITVGGNIFRVLV